MFYHPQHDFLVNNTNNYQTNNYYPWLSKPYSTSVCVATPCVQFHREARKIQFVDDEEDVPSTSPTTAANLSHTRSACGGAAFPSSMSTPDQSLGAQGRGYTEGRVYLPVTLQRLIKEEAAAAQKKNNVRNNKSKKKQKDDIKRENEGDANYCPASDVGDDQSGESFLGCSTPPATLALPSPIRSPTSSVNSNQSSRHSIPVTRTATTTTTPTASLADSVGPSDCPSPPAPTPKKENSPIPEELTTPFRLPVERAASQFEQRQDQSSFWFSSFQEPPTLAAGPPTIVRIRNPYAACLTAKQRATCLDRKPLYCSLLPFEVLISNTTATSTASNDRYDNSRSTAHHSSLLGGSSPIFTTTTTSAEEEGLHFLLPPPTYDSAAERPPPNYFHHHEGGGPQQQQQQEESFYCPPSFLIPRPRSFFPAIHSEEDTLANIICSRGSHRRARRKEQPPQQPLSLMEVEKGEEEDPTPQSSRPRQHSHKMKHDNKNKSTTTNNTRKKKNNNNNYKKNEQQFQSEVTTSTTETAESPDGNLKMISELGGGEASIRPVWLYRQTIRECTLEIFDHFKKHQEVRTRDTCLPKNRKTRVDHQLVLLEPSCPGAPATGAYYDPSMLIVPCSSNTSSSSGSGSSSDSPLLLTPGTHVIVRALPQVSPGEWIRYDQRRAYFTIAKVKEVLPPVCSCDNFKFDFLPRVIGLPSKSDVKNRASAKQAEKFIVSHFLHESLHGYDVDKAPWMTTSSGHIAKRSGVLQHIKIVGCEVTLGKEMMTMYYSELDSGATQRHELAANNKSSDLPQRDLVIIHPAPSPPPSSQLSSSPSCIDIRCYEATKVEIKSEQSRVNLDRVMKVLLKVMVAKHGLGGVPFQQWVLVD